MRVKFTEEIKVKQEEAYDPFAEEYTQAQLELEFQSKSSVYHNKNWSLYGTANHCGVTQSMLATFLSCPEKMRLGSVEALTSEYERKEAAEFGNFFHDALDAIYSGYMEAKDKDGWLMQLDKRIYTVVEKIYEIRKGELRDMNYPLDDLELHSELAKVMLPMYFTFWKEDWDAEWLGLERVHCWEYKKLRYPVMIRAKMDGEKRSKTDGRIRVKDTKTKGQIVEKELALKLNIDLQELIYLYTIWMETGEMPAGFEYDIIRNPQERRKANETVYEYCLRVQSNVAANPGHYFIRMNVNILKADLVEFGKRFDNYMSQLEKWYLGDFHYLNPTACTGRGYTCIFLRFCGGGDQQFYVKKDHVFRELHSLGVKAVLAEEENNA